MKYLIAFFIGSILTFSSIAQDLKPTESMALVTSYVVYTNTGDTLPDRELKFISDSTGKVYEGSTGSDRLFKVLLPEGDTYTIEYRNILGNIQQGKLPIPSLEGVINQGFSISLTLEKSTKHILLDNIYFDSGSANLKATSNETLDAFVEGMKYTPNLVIEIQGHTDSDGDDEMNMNLSQDRAEAVRQYAINKGIEGSRITAKGFGETKPVATNDTEEGKQKNRRTELVILSQ